MKHKNIKSGTLTNRATGARVLSGRAMHCFTDGSGKPLILKKAIPGI